MLTHGNNWYTDNADDIARTDLQSMCCVAEALRKPLMVVSDSSVSHKRASYGINSSASTFNTNRDVVIIV